MTKTNGFLVCGMALLLLAQLAASARAQTGTWRNAMLQRRQQNMTLPADIQIVRDVRYGDDPQQRFDVYLPPHAAHAPVIFMVHGGAWAFGDKTARGVVQNKVSRWVSQGFIFISIDYRMLPQASPRVQAEDVALALAYAQQHAAQWGGDSDAFVVMGHSAGAHLVALISTDTSIGKRQGVAPWLGTISLDSAALNVVAIMQARHLPLYDRAFGNQSDDWASVSPLQQMRGSIVPFLAVCSTQRKDSCPQAQSFVTKAVALGTHASVLGEDLTHEQINETLGLDSDYTRQVESFMRSLSPSIAQRLSGS
ncbi:alpha/beta hydrolase [Dyella sp. 2HG41-7]|uniref:alpha/beta hydrolase fold domain-containing protein n=1 Tax=Dyella sp. 2HG41-7 TaxID=2883239 RepID=UPI001F2A29E3|nr:alpha/beta hydrolase [Dyella sp. 2HG41-7]